MVLTYAPCDVTHLTDILNICWDLTYTKPYEKKQILLDILDNNFCKHIIKRGKNKNKLCLIKHKNEGYYCSSHSVKDNILRKCKGRTIRGKECRRNVKPYQDLCNYCIKKNIKNNSISYSCYIYYDNLYLIEKPIDYAIGSIVLYTYNKLNYENIYMNLYTLFNKYKITCCVIYYIIHMFSEILKNIKIHSTTNLNYQPVLYKNNVYGYIKNNKSSLCNSESIDFGFDCLEEQQSHYNCIITEVASDEYVQDLLIIENNIFEYDKNISFHQNEKYKNISNNIKELYNRLNILNNKIIENNKNIEKLKILKNHKTIGPNVDINYYLNNGIRIINDNHLNDISVYDLYNGKKIDTKKLIDKYKKIEYMYNYIKKHNKFFEYKRYNKDKSYYIKEKEVINLIKLILLRIDNYKYELNDFSPQTWIYLLNELTNDIESYIVDFSNLDEKYKIFI